MSVLFLVAVGIMAATLAFAILVEDRSERAGTELPELPATDTPIHDRLWAETFADQLDDETLERIVWATRNADRREAANRLANPTAHCVRCGRMDCPGCAA